MLLILFFNGLYTEFKNFTVGGALSYAILKGSLFPLIKIRAPIGVWL